MRADGPATPAVADPCSRVVPDDAWVACPLPPLEEGGGVGEGRRGRACPPGW